MIRRAALLPLLVLSLAACDLLGTGPDPSGELSVSSVSPANGESNVPLDVTVSATLEPSSSTITSVSNQTVTLTQTDTGSVVTADVTSSGNTITLDPTDSLSASTSYTFAISTEVKDQDGAALASAYSSTFTTGTEGTSPTNPTNPGEPPKTAALEANANRLIFEAQNGQSSASQTLTLSNTGNAAFTLSSLEPTDSQFSLTNAPSLPAEIAPSDSVEVEVTFQPTELGPQTALLNANGSPLTVGLRGLSVVGREGDKEPSLQWILDTFNLPISTGDDDPSTTAIANPPEDSQARRDLFNSTLGDEVPLQRFQKAGSGEVTIEVLAAYAVDSKPVTEFGWYDIADPETKNKIFEIEGGTGNAQTLNPDTVGSLSFDPGNTSFGLYSLWPSFGNRYIYTQDALNTFSNAIPHQVRAFPYKTADGVVEPNAYVLGTEEFTQGYDYNDIVVVVRNVRPSTEDPFSCNQGQPITASRVLSQSVGGGLELQNPSGAPFADRLVFSRIGNISGNFGESRIEPFINLQCHDLNVLRLENTSSSPINVNSLNISGSDSSAFTLPNGGAGFSIGAGDTKEILVQFVEDVDSENGNSKGIREANLQLQTSAGAVTVELAGIYQVVPEGGSELYLEQVVEAFGYSTNVGANKQGGLSSADPASPKAGDEVRSRFWQRANSSEPVYIRQIAAFHSCCTSSSNDTIKVEVNGSTLDQFEHAENYGQSVLPPLQGSDNKAAEMSVSPSGPFELTIRGYSTDWVGGDSNNGNLGVRLWPAKRDGTEIENTYIVAQDFVSAGCGTTDTANCDFNDNMYLITNVTPVSPE